MKYLGVWRQFGSRAVALGGAGALMLAALTACGSGPGDAKSAGSTDKNCVSGEGPAAIPEKLPAEYTPLTAKPAAGKSVIYLGSSVATSTPETSKAMEEATGVLGWKYALLQYDGGVEDFNAKLNEAIDRGADVIMALGIPAAASQAPLERAKAKGIVVVYGSVSDQPTSATGLAGVVHNTATFQAEGAHVAQWLMADSDCKAKVVYFGLPLEILKASGEQMKKTFADDCPNCSIKLSEMQFSDIGAPSGTQAIISALQADPTITYVGVATGGQANGLRAALDQAGFKDVRIFGITAPSANDLKGLQDGTESVWVATTGTMISWNMVDAAARVMETGKPVSGMPYPYALLDHSNVPKDATEFPSYPTDFETEYKTLWKAS